MIRINEKIAVYKLGGRMYSVSESGAVLMSGSLDARLTYALCKAYRTSDAYLVQQLMRTLNKYDY